MNTPQITHWPVLDCMGRRIEYLCRPGRPGFMFQGRRVGGEWHTISAMVYENRNTWPREGYEVRMVKEQP